jgi:hypothetical protein
VSFAAEDIFGILMFRDEIFFNTLFVTVTNGVAAEYFILRFLYQLMFLAF